jgi:hypothetical protein
MCVQVALSTPQGKGLVVELTQWCKTCQNPDERELARHLLDPHAEDFYLLRSRLFFNGRPDVYLEAVPAPYPAGPSEWISLHGLEKLPNRIREAQELLGRGLRYLRSLSRAGRPPVTEPTEEIQTFLRRAGELKRTHPELRSWAARQTYLEGKNCPGSKMAPSTFAEYRKRWPHLLDEFPE